MYFAGCFKKKEIHLIENIFTPSWLIYISVVFRASCRLITITNLTQLLKKTSDNDEAHNQSKIKGNDLEFRNEILTASARKIFCAEYHIRIKNAPTKKTIYQLVKKFKAYGFSIDMQEI